MKTQVSIRRVHQETIPVSEVGCKHLAFLVFFVLFFKEKLPVADMITRVKFCRNVQFRLSNDF